jgi:leucyl/phenylalanyl-tRNA--protein transferase
MPVFALDERLVFPSPHYAHRSGLLAVGGDLRPERLLLAYRSGIFPWYSEGEPICWHSPDPRGVLLASQVHVPRSLRKAARRHGYTVRTDTAFEEVIRRCSEAPRPGQDGTWITQEMIEAYLELHHAGFAHSIEAYRGTDLVGGLYGLSLGAAFFGESMFSLAPDASKVAFVTLAAQLQRWNIELIDCQIRNEHTTRFGAADWPRKRFLAALELALQAPTLEGPWELDAELLSGGAFEQLREES